MDLLTRREFDAEHLWLVNAYWLLSAKNQDWTVAKHDLNTCQPHHFLRLELGSDRDTWLPFTTITNIREARINLNFKTIASGPSDEIIEQWKKIIAALKLEHTQFLESQLKELSALK